MSARVLAIALGLACSAAAAQIPAPPPPSAGVEKGNEEAKRQARREIFERALQEHLAAEKGGPDAEARLRNAAAGYRKVLELQPAAAAYYNLARAEEALGELANAESSFRNAATREGADRTFYLDGWASFLDRQGKKPEAMKVYEELLLLDPRHDRSFDYVRTRLLEAGPDRLLDFLWKIVAAKQRDRATDLALTAIERRSAPYGEAELLTVVAAAMAERAQEPEALRGSDLDKRLEALATRAEIGRGVVELRTLYLRPGQYGQPFPWWNKSDLEWAHSRGVSRRDAFRALMRAVGDGYRSRGGTDVAAGCYEAAAEFGDDPDPVALRRLATVYIETNRLDRLNALAERHANPSSRLYDAKNRYYREGKLEKVLLYHRTLGQIYGSLAHAGKGGWGSTGNYASAMFQLQRAYDVARELDRVAGKPPDGGATRVDADLAVLYAQGLEATGEAEKATTIRLDTAATFVAAGDGKSAGKVLRGIDERKLTAPDATRYRAYRKVAPSPLASRPDDTGGTAAPADSGTKATGRAAAAANVESQIVVGEAGANTNLESRVAGKSAAVGRMNVAQVGSRPRQFELPATALWFDTGIDLARGRALRIRAAGTWSNSGPPGVGPGGFAGYLYPGTIVATAPLAALVAKVGQSSFAVGAAFDGASPADGRLYLAINDSPDTFGDNQGSLTVTVELP